MGTLTLIGRPRCESGAARRLESQPQGARAVSSGTSKAAPLRLVDSEAACAARSAAASSAPWESAAAISAACTPVRVASAAFACCHTRATSPTTNAVPLPPAIVQGESATGGEVRGGETVRSADGCSAGAQRIASALLRTTRSASERIGVVVVASLGRRSLRFASFPMELSQRTPSFR